MAKPTTRKDSRGNNGGDSSPAPEEGSFDPRRIEILEMFEEVAHPGLAQGCYRRGDRRYQAQR